MQDKEWKNALQIVHLLLLALRTSSCVRDPISAGKLVNLLYARWSWRREVNEPNAEGNVVNLQKERGEILYIEYKK